MVLLRPFCRQPQLSLFFHSSWQNEPHIKRVSGPSGSCRLPFLYGSTSCQLPIKAIGSSRAALHRRSQWLSSTASSYYHNKGCLSARFSSWHKLLFLCRPLHLKKDLRYLIFTFQYGCISFDLLASASLDRCKICKFQ